MSYTLHQIAKILSTSSKGNDGGPIQHFVTDSRKVNFPEQTLFFAISGHRRTGAIFIPELYLRGVKYFVIDIDIDESLYPGAVFFKVTNTIQALQTIAVHHRSRFNIPVIGITGSNGKTIVKEWLFQLLQSDYTIVRSPRSYNSQIGVPLSVLQMNAHHTLGIFEAGISTINEMQALEKIIQPTIGVFTNITDVHSEGFASNLIKTTEKALLFSHTAEVIVAADFVKYPIKLAGNIITWGSNQADTLYVLEQVKCGDYTAIKAIYLHKEISINIPFVDDISIQNALTCFTVLLFLGYDLSTIQLKIAQLEHVEMRMQLRKGINNCFVLNDSYSNDKISLSLALNFLKEQAADQQKTVVLSDIIESGQNDATLYNEVVLLLKQSGVNKLYAIGETITRFLSTKIVQDNWLDNTIQVALFKSTDDFLNELNQHHFQNEYILLKGARKFEFEQIANWLEYQVHQTVLEINLSSLVKNLTIYQSILKPSTRLMAMVKAFSYGSGAGEVARKLQQQQVDYLAVAYADEGVALRKAGVSLPIMVMSPDEHSFDVLINYNLEPEIFSFDIFYSFQQFLIKEGIPQYPIHLKLNTGMNRLGFEPHEINTLTTSIIEKQQVIVKSVFSHLVASEEAALDEFTQQQVNLFSTCCFELEQQLGYTVIKHIANTAAIARNPAYQLDMVRLGIGLYGIDSAVSDKFNLQQVATLKTTVAQIRKVLAGDTVGYGRKGILTRDSLIATVRIGYADGYSRRLGNGVGKMFINGAYAPVIGNVCMDMTMLDITDIPDVIPGDVVEVFGNHVTIQSLAADSGTIAYEIMTGINQRVKRMYFEE